MGLTHTHGGLQFLAGSVLAACHFAARAQQLPPLRALLAEDILEGSNVTVQSDRAETLAFYPERHKGVIILQYFAEFIATILCLKMLL